MCKRHYCDEVFLRCRDFPFLKILTEYLKNRFNYRCIFLSLNFEF